MTDPSRRILLGGLSGLCLTRGLAAQEVPRPRFDKLPEYRIFDAVPETHALSRQDVTVGGRGYRLFRAIPKGVPPEAGWPSIWMLDGNAVFDRIGPRDLAAHPGLAIIGIGYPVARIFDTTARALDYTPPGPEATDDRGRPVGGADAFRARLTGPLREAAGAGAGLDPTRRVLWGHSYGGLFALHCLLTDPRVFAGWAPVSPSTGFGGRALRRLADTAPHLPAGGIALLRIMLGDAEHRSGTAAPAGPRPAPETMALAEILGRRADLEVTVTVLRGLGHGETFAASFGPAMDLAAGLAA